LCFGVLDAFDAFLARVSLAAHRDSLSLAAGVLAELLRAEAASSQQTGAATLLASAAERCLTQLLDARHSAAARDAVMVALLAPLLGSPQVDGVLPPRTPSAPSAATLRARARVLGFARAAIASAPVDSLESAVTLLQHVCARAPDRTEYRALAAGAAAELATALLARDEATAQRWHAFAQRLSRHTRPTCRATSVELAAAMIRCQLGAQALVDAAALQASAAHAFLHVLVQRAADKHPTVRQRALHCLGGLLESGADALPHAAQRDAVRRALLELRDDAAPGDSGSVLELLKRRLFDTRIAVRRSALQLAAQLFGAEQRAGDAARRAPLTVGFVDCLLACVDDESMLVRKAAAAAVSSLLVMHGDAPEVRTAWCAGVLPLVADNEPSVAQVSTESFASMLLARVCASHSAADPADAVWPLVTQAVTSQLPFVERALAQLAANSRLDVPALFAALRWRVTLPQADDAALVLPAWQLLASLVPFASKKSLAVDFVVAQWRAVQADVVAQADLACAVLGALGPLASRLSKADAAALGEQLLATALALPPAAGLARATIVSLARLGAELQAAPRAWLAQLLQRADAALAFELEEKSAGAADAETLVGALAVLGEAAQRCESASHMPERALTMMTVLASRDALPAKVAARFPRGRVPSRVRAHAIVSLGKLCLLDAALARRLLGTFVKELQLPADAGEIWRAERHSDAAPGADDDDVVRNNALVVLCDLCAKHTHLIDTQLPLLANLVADSNALIRRQLLQLLSDLLRENYIKWRPVLVMRVALCLADECESVRALAVTLLEDFATQQSDHVANVFVELLFHACGCYAHSRFNTEFNSSERERHVFHLGDNVAARLCVYKAFLAMMSDEAKFAVQADIVQNVLTAFLRGEDNQLRLDRDDDDSSRAVLADALAVLAMPEAQLSAAALATDDKKAAADGDDPAAAAVAAAHGKLLKRVVEKSITEHTVPVCVALKATLEQERSPLLSNLMHFLVQVLEMHESAVEDALASNRRLARELRFDLDRFKASQQQQQQVPQMRAGTDDGGFDDDDDNDDDERVVATQAPLPVAAPTPHRPAAAAQLSTPFRTPSRARIAATSAAVPLSAAKVKATAVAAAAPPPSDDAPVVMRPKTPWSSLRVKSVAQETDLQSVSTALSFDAPPTAGDDDGDSNDDAFRVASTPKPRAVDKENAARNRKRVQK
jgi:condensin-2 complex subunit D3